jgi:hypothetical protein
VVVANPDGSTASCPGCLAVIAAPTITDLNPSTVTRGSTISGFTVTGAGFAAGVTLKAPTGVSFAQTVVVNAETITATMTVSGSAPTGSGLPVKVRNNASAGYGTATANQLTISP